MFDGADFEWPDQPNLPRHHMTRFFIFQRLALGGSLMEGGSPLHHESNIGNGLPRFREQVPSH